MVGWKTIFRRSNSQSLLDAHSSLQDNEALMAASAVTGEEKDSRDIATEGTAGCNENGEALPEAVRDYFYPNMDKDSAQAALQARPIGTFLLRKSKCAGALYTLSVKSERTIFNVRIYHRQQERGGYHLDAPRHLRKYFPTISDLLRYYSDAPKELIALCSNNDGQDETTTFKLAYPLSRSESALDAASIAGGGAGHDGLVRPTARSVARQPNGGSLKAMIKWL